MFTCSPNSCDSEKAAETHRTLRGVFFLRRGAWQQLLSSCGNESQKGPPRSGSAGISVHSYRKGSSERLVVFNYPGPVSSFCEKRIIITLQGCHIKLNDIASFSSVQFSSVAQSCPTLCDPMNCGTPGLPVHHQLPEFTQTHVHRVGDAIQPSHPLFSPSPPAPQSLPASGSFPMSQLFT